MPTIKGPANIRLSIPGDTPIVNKNNGRLNPEWKIWFTNLHKRTGGTDAPSNNDLSDQVNINTADITTLKSDVANNNASINALNNQVSTINKNITSLQLQVNNNTTNINNLTILTNNNTANIKTLTNQVNTNTSNITTLQSQMTIANSNISALQSNTIQNISNQGTGIGIFINKTGNTANLKSIQAGTNITIDNTTDPNTMIINASGGGSSVNEGSGTGGHNSSVIYSQNGLQLNTTGSANTGVGYNSLFNNTTGSNNVAIGNSALYTNTNSTDNIAIGYQSLYALNFSLGANYNIGIGTQALYHSHGVKNVAIGYQAMYQATSTDGNSQSNVAIGDATLYNNISGGSNVAIGSSAMFNNTTGSDNFALGASSLLNNTTGTYNVGIGIVAMRENLTGTQNVGIGLSALRYSTANNYQVGIGSMAGANSAYDNITCLGNGTDTTGANQVQLGNSSTTTYVYGTVQNRSDARDKTNIIDNPLGLNFIMSLKPKQWQWNYRTDYIIREVDPLTNDIKITTLVNDGSKTRSRYHNGFIAQDIKAYMDTNNIDFAGYQDHNIQGGDDVLSLGYDEFIAPLVKAIQELKAIVDNQQTIINQLTTK